MKQLLIILFIFCVLKCNAQTLYGFNENSYPAYNNEAFTDSIAVLKPNIIRYPDGIGANMFDWKNTSKYNTLAYLRKMQLKVGCDILFVLNMNNSSLAYQIEMLDSAAALGIPIKYVEFGSEVNNDGNALLKKFHSSGIEYGTECKYWADAIKAKYPTVKCGAWAENKLNSLTWVQDLLSVYTPDAMVAHLYPNPQYFIDSNGVIDTALFIKIIDKSFAIAGIDFSHPVWVTEFNINPNMLKYLKRGQHRIALKIMFTEFQKLGIEMIIVHSLSQGTNGAFEVYSDGHVIRRLTGDVFYRIMKQNHRL